MEAPRNVWVDWCAAKAFKTLTLFKSKIVHFPTLIHFVSLTELSNFLNYDHGICVFGQKITILSTTNVDHSLTTFTQFSRLLVQKDTLFNSLNSEVVYLV